ncbi:MAG: transglycosylase domain-containing protein [Actinomycetota bacterium]
MADRVNVKASTRSASFVDGARRLDESPPVIEIQPEPLAPKRHRLPLRMLIRLAHIKKWKLVILAFVLVFAVLGSIVYFGPASLGSLGPLQNAELTYFDGQHLAEIRPEQNRVVVPLSQIPKIVRNAFIAAEDERFWSHWGVDPIAIIRAIGANAKGFRQGASTITQQLVRNNESLKVGSKRSLMRKIREAILAIRVDRRYSKYRILSEYLNSIYLGNGAYGVEAASLLYFGADIQKITDPERAALLAGITASPNRFDPRRYPKRAEERRNYVLGRMRALHYISLDQMNAAEATHVYVIPPHAVATQAPGFVDWARSLLRSDFGDEEVYRGGLRVRTTLDLSIQNEAERAVAQTLGQQGDPEASVVVMDVATGGIRAMVGGRHELPGDLNLATQAQRQAGSAFKPFVLAAALDQGKTLDDRYDAPASIRLRLPNDQSWFVRNYDDSGYGYPTLRRALAHSVNTVFAQLIRDIGPDSVVRMATRAGITTDLRPVYSLALGTSEVNPLDMATAYATFARGGEYKPPTAFADVTDASGNVLLKNETSDDHPGRQVMKETVASDVIDGMTSVVTDGTGAPAQLPTCTTWGKTGTTEDHADGWFVGGACGIVTAVWVGYPQGRIPMTNVHGIQVVGSSFPAQIWKQVMLAMVSKYHLTDQQAQPQQFDYRSSNHQTHSTAPVPAATTSDESTPAPTPRQSQCILVLCTTK